jgi:antitoxin (DNA-binding transcriptional repressor) of toxin-antitoxin stability system
VSEPAITIRAEDEPTWAEVVRRAEHGESVSVIAHGDHVADVVPSGELDRLRETIEELRVSPGSIVLSHDGGPEPNATLMQQLDRLVGSMTDAGYTFVTVRGLLAARGPGSADGVPGRPRPGSP